MNEWLHRPRRRALSAALCCLALVLFPALPGFSQSPTNVLTSASFDSLQTAVSAGGTIVLAFDGSIPATAALEIAFDWRVP